MDGPIIGFVIASLAIGALVSTSLFQIARRRTVERDERFERAQFNGLLNSLGDGVLIVDKHGRTLMHNGASEQMLGPMPAGTTAAERASRCNFCYPDRTTRYPINDLPLARAIRGESSQGVEVFARHPETGRGMILNLTATPLRDPDGAIEGGVAVFRDISEKKRTR